MASRSSTPGVDDGVCVTVLRIAPPIIDVIEGLAAGETPRLPLD